MGGVGQIFVSIIEWHELKNVGNRWINLYKHYIHLNTKLSTLIIHRFNF